MSMTFGSLFAGIGGFDLGFERAGMVCKWQVEIDDYANRGLAKHWPDVRRWGDVRTFPPDPWQDWTVDVICGGFPCQDISVAGKQAGVSEGTRSGLYREVLRIAGVVRPRQLFLENVSAILSNGLATVLGDLAALGYDTRWLCIRASDVGAPHHRDRWFLLADIDSKGFQERFMLDGIPGKKESNDNRENPTVGSWWSTEPNLVRVVHGVPNRTHRIKGLGNAQVPLQAAVAWRLLGGE
jgi:DNA (cytosine-5)-methyltransferase 1